MEIDEPPPSWDTRHALEEVPKEIQRICQMQQMPGFLDALALAALQPLLTLKLFTKFEIYFADTCARWVKNSYPKSKVIAAFARILPLVPHLGIFLEMFLASEAERDGGIKQLCWDTGVEEIMNTIELQRMLLATWRLLDLDKHTFARMVDGVKIQCLLQHQNLAVRYLAVRILSQLLSAADFKLEELVREHVGRKEMVKGDFDGREIDLIFLSVLEENRLQEADNLRIHMKASAEERPSLCNLNGLSPLVVQKGGILLPRPGGAPSSSSSMVNTVTTSMNMAKFGACLISRSPILLHGLSGSGKTSLVNDFAREFGMESSMVTLYLNEQTDAKMLIGMYTTGSSPGSFVWKAGVLTTAVRDGRWVFIEDLDRAPNEVISVILPLIERGELLIPSRGETIKAGPGFRLLASIRTSIGITGHEITPTLNMLGARLWQRVPVEMPSQGEFRQIIDEIYPILHEFISGIMNVYYRLRNFSLKSPNRNQSGTFLGRTLSPRDLLKWCRRLEGVLLSGGSITGREPISDGVRYEMFLEAVDCFASSLPTANLRKEVVSAIAEGMHIDPQRTEYFMTAHVPKYEEYENRLVIGRARLPRRARVTKPTRRPRTFANTSHVKRLLEQIGVAVKLSEPVLLVGETGTGKTTAVQQLADCLGHKLTVVNLSQQSEVGDLLGGYKPVSVRTLAMPLKDEFDELFSLTGLSATKNQKYIERLSKIIAKGQWTRAIKLWREAPKMFDQCLSKLIKEADQPTLKSASEQPSKRRKIVSRLQNLLDLKPRWNTFSEKLDHLENQLSSGGPEGFSFTFFEGNIIKAARNGDWVLLDEINLASADTLESIADLLNNEPGKRPSILLSETGETEKVCAHHDFRIFGAMNPATDVGKRDLPLGIRSRFTEIYVDSPDRNLDDLLCVIKAYLKRNSTNDLKAAQDLAKLYLNTKRLADQKSLVDGANQVPHYSFRTLTRVLSYVDDTAPHYGLRRALSEGFAMGFLTLLDRDSEKMLTPLIHHYLLGDHLNVKALLSQTPKYPADGKQYVSFKSAKKDRHYWLLQGNEALQEQQHYIRTPSVDRNMLNLVRATSTRRYPVLIQGPTSSGKTSMIEYLAKLTGNKCVRINNHEHTDLQEYLGSYDSDADGQLYFKEGLLVQALREGHWIILDELNLAPTDVLEALNRLLDDNRELLIPETQQIFRPHENFMLFATQNPPGLYGGRKNLSRAFRNRFLELHFDDIPEDELETILQTRCRNVAPSDCGRIVKVYKELSKLRQSNRLFERKESFATLRDLFRWAFRAYETRDQLAINGYMLLAERVRNPEERNAVKMIIEKAMKVKIDPTQLYNVSSSSEIQSYNSTSNTHGVVWTQAMRRLFILVSHAIRNNEPVLLVGETGCGKTTVCQMLADAFSQKLRIVNAHQNTETGDLIGAQRPVRNRNGIVENLRHDLLKALRDVGRIFNENQDLNILLEAYRTLPESSLQELPLELKQRIHSGQSKAKSLFEWSDGSLVQAMREGQLFLLDEISLADDAVLERLNSVLEPERTILLAEKGVEDSLVQAVEGFQFFATMNPGGDYGKRELSPALRNRFTEIWVPSLSNKDDVFQIVESKLKPELKKFSEAMVLFAEWFGQNYRSASVTSITVRDILAWVKFMNECGSHDPYLCVVQGAAMVYIDTLGANPAALLAIDSQNIKEEREKCLQRLSTLLKHDITPLYFNLVEIINEECRLTVGNFSVQKEPGADHGIGYVFEAPTTKLNTMRIIRALQVQKPILIEGSPGVGKTTLITALARACNRPLTRINLSEQTDLMDLFGSDVPVEGAEAGHFAWRDASFLQAMQKGDWVLLDEMNLASQSVLEGLNACLDHRGEVYISELDQTFKRHPNFSVFAAQNSHHQGGGRKGLPSSFVNRFTVVYADVLGYDDLQLICRQSFPEKSEEMINTVIAFVSRLEYEVVQNRTFGSHGGPWEFNLRDILRWLHLLTSKQPLLQAAQPSDFLNIIFRQRFRNINDRLEVDRIFAEIFSSPLPFRHFFHNASASAYQVGLAYLSRDLLVQKTVCPKIDLVHRQPELESIMICVQQNIPCILVGLSGTGKSAALEHIAAMTGNEIVVFPLNSDIDTMDLVGGFEQVDPQRAASAFLEELASYFSQKVLSLLPNQLPDEAITFLERLNSMEPLSAHLFLELTKQLRSLEAKFANENFGHLAERCQVFSETLMTLKSARFEWVDGVLIKALEQGKWIVLDNANLCSASVLDRLNSLLEPQSFLSINEHYDPNGEPKVIKPHPNFRIFLTMDPRFGELSRAMRNRAVEIYFEPSSNPTHCRLSATCSESSMKRFRTLSQFLRQINTNKLHNIYSVAFDNLSWSDLSLLPRFITSLDHVQSLGLGPLCEAYMSIHDDPQNETLRNLIWETASIFNHQLPRDAQVSDRAVPFFAFVLIVIINQIFHPLQNSPLVPVIVQSHKSEQIYWLGTTIEFLLEISAGFRAQHSQEASILNQKPGTLNRFQRSLVKERVSAVANESTANTADFLDVTLKSLKGYLQNQTFITGQWSSLKTIISDLLGYWWETYNLVTAPVFEEATFQAHLAIGNDLLSNLSSQDCFVVQAFKHALENAFPSGFRLNTGLSMEIMWKQLRPTVITNFKVFNTLAKMEDLAMRFDNLKSKASCSISSMLNIMDSLIKAYMLILASEVDGTALTASLAQEMEVLESKAKRDEETELPFFHNQFEAIRQYQIIEKMRSGKYEDDIDLEIMVLSGHSTVSLMKFSTSTSSSRFLQTINLFWGSDGDFHPASNALSSGLLESLKHIGDVKLRGLGLLEFELPIIGRKLALSSAMLCRDQVLVLNTILINLIQGVVRTHGEGVLQYWNDLCSLEKMSGDSFNNKYIEPHLQRVLRDHFLVSYRLITVLKGQSTSTLQSSSLSWVHFAIGCVILYVPDKAFDPDKRQRLELQRYAMAKDLLTQKMDALMKFEKIFSGQSSNLRCHLLENDIKDLKDPPEVIQEVYRPEVSKMNQLQEEFKNLLKIVLESNIVATIANVFETKDMENANILQVLSVLHDNITQVIRRISHGFQAYNDLIQPVISMLQCLQIGLSLAKFGRSCSPKSNESCIRLAENTPFMGVSGKFPSDDLVEMHPMEYLALASTNAAIESKSELLKSRKSLLKAVHGCYGDWKERLQADRHELESQSSLYRFSGSAEDETEFDKNQFDELFPGYDEDEIEPVDRSSTLEIRETVIKLAKTHAEIFVMPGRPVESIKKLIRNSSTCIGSLINGDRNFEGQSMTSILLPGSLLLLDDKFQELDLDVAQASYNFYMDPNLSECRKLVILAHKIQDRFRELQAIDEIGHMQPLQDVLLSCNELLQFHHTAPLAKIITKVEKVHAFMHEWQFGGWASKANSALTLYESITSTIVSWRRLELSTWSKLFDMQTANFEDDARSWWFVAYEVVVAAPLQISEPNEMRDYAQKLLKDLQTYFSSSIIGQFLQRLQLLSQLKKHLELLQLEVPIISIITTAVANFIALYSRYEKPVLEIIMKGRLGLEKLMRDVLLMASWKDTNIVALRESAKRSHHKLFKIVKKFRALLSQPMDPILGQGLPDYEIEKEITAPKQSQIVHATVDLSALALCSSSVPHWSKKSKRFVNVSQTVNMMANEAHIPATVVDSFAYLKGFLDNFITSTSELQKATPLTLTEENKDQVKHLKSRKRKMFADTLKELRQMGIKYNLNSDALAHQGSLSLVLTALEYAENISTNGMQYYFHKFIDIIPRARDSTKHHFSDLSSAEVARSIGFLEGLLQIVICQHNVLSKAALAMATLGSNLLMIAGLWAPDYVIRAVKRGSSHTRVLQWLPNILKVGVDLIKVHSRFKKINSPVQAKLETWIDRFVNLKLHWDSLPRLPSQITSTKHISAQDGIDEAVRQLAIELADMQENHPDLGFILSHIITWTQITYFTSDKNPDLILIPELDARISRLGDSVLVAVENYKKGIANLPTSSDDPGWLAKSNIVAQTNLSALHVEAVSGQIQDCFILLTKLNLEDDQTSKSASACFTVILPILQQYHRILQDSVQRYADLHRATCKTSYFLAKTFIHIATQGFCSPEKPEKQGGNTEKLEGGTGLGDGEGSEDISKDIQEDEDLDELGQEPNTDQKSEISDEQDAVDMADCELEGKLGDAQEKDEDVDCSEDEQSQDGMSEEAGDVDDFDPTAVDEKMWDGDEEEAEKNQQGDESKGKQNKDEQVASEGNKKDVSCEGDEGDEGDESQEDVAGDEQEDQVKQSDVENHDPHADEGEVLDLPDNMELDGEDQKRISGDEDGMDDFSDIEDSKQQDEVSNDGETKAEEEMADQQDSQEPCSEMDIINSEESEEGRKTDEVDEKNNEEDADEHIQDEQNGLLRDRNDDPNADTSDTTPTDTQGVGEDQDNNTGGNTENPSKAQRDEGGQGEESSEDKAASAESKQQGCQADSNVSQDTPNETQDAVAAQPFKKLGDALQEWHRQQSEIRNPTEPREPDQDCQIDLDKNCSNFQHLPDDDAAADTQALGAAAEEQAQAFEDSMAVEPETQDIHDQFQPQEIEEDEVDHADEMDIDEPSASEDQEKLDGYDGRAGAIIKQARDKDMDNNSEAHIQQIEEKVDEVEHRLQSAHIKTQTSLRPYDDARQQWIHYEIMTRDSSLYLTEQLRLILAPILATKMRGDFRTGKRLNIKRIIPYIASQYKRDKIWMRRSIPSKRSYQIMLAVDDSMSMGESRSGALAFQTLVMISKSLHMLEVGEICVVGFGEDFKVAHDFDIPFSTDAGPKALQHFSFQQNRTDVYRLVKESMELFRSAKARSSHESANLWQLELIISDGICESRDHDKIRRLLREALEERIMMVFVIMDDVKHKKGGQSVMDLNQASFIDGTVVTSRYLDSFPFQYYIVVNDVKELPGVLATLLRQWFQDIVGSC